MDINDLTWNPWHGCHKCSEGCQNCYAYFLDKDMVEIQMRLLLTNQIMTIL